MAVGSMTISSLVYRGHRLTPVVKAPQVAILGASKAYSRPVPGADGGISWRIRLTLSLGYDHRVINGADAARFVVSLGQLLGAMETD